MTNILVCIANHGIYHKEYLNTIIDNYRKMPIEIKIMVLSDLRKELGPDVAVRVGTPNKNPLSLPFVHRQLFREFQNDFDYFIYSEDDIFVTYRNVEAFIEATKMLNDDEIVGFLLSETWPNGELSYVGCHSFFRWSPDSVRVRGGKLWAHHTDEHSAFFIASRAQIKRAIQSGAFPLSRTRAGIACGAARQLTFTFLVEWSA